MRVAIIGGGYCGCLCAYQVARSLKCLQNDVSDQESTATPGHEIVLLEQRDRLGGSVRSVCVHGVNVEVGLWDTFAAHDLRVHELVQRSGLSIQARRASSPSHGGLFSSAVLDWPAEGDGPLVSYCSFGGLPLFDWVTSVFEHSGLSQLLPFLLAMLAMRVALIHERWLPRLGWVIIGLSFMWMSISQVPYLYFLHWAMMRSWQKLQLFRRFGASSRYTTLLGAGFADQWRRIYRQGVAYCWSVAQFLQTSDMRSWAVTSVAEVCRDARIRLAFAEHILEPVALREVFGWSAGNEAQDRKSHLLLQVNGFAGLRAMAALNLHDADEYGVREGLETLCHRLVEQSGARVLRHCRVTRIFQDKSPPVAQDLPRWRLELDKDMPTLDLCFDAVVIACAQPPSIADLDMSRIEHPLREAARGIAPVESVHPSQLSDRAMQTPNAAQMISMNDSSSQSEANEASLINTTPTTKVAVDRGADESLTRARTAEGSVANRGQDRRVVAIVVGRLADYVLMQCGYQTEDRFPDLIVLKTPLYVDTKTSTVSCTESPQQRPKILRPAAANELGLVRIDRIAKIDQHTDGRQKAAPRYLYRLLFLATGQCRDVPCLKPDDMWRAQGPTGHESSDASTSEAAPFLNACLRPLFRRDTNTSEESTATDANFEPHGVYVSPFHSFRCYPLQQHADMNKELVTVLGARLLYPAMMKRLAPGLEMMALGARMTCTLLEDHIRWIAPSPAELPRYERILQSPFNAVGWIE